MIPVLVGLALLGIVGAAVFWRQRRPPEPEGLPGTRDEFVAQVVYALGEEGVRAVQEGVRVRLRGREPFQVEGFGRWRRAATLEARRAAVLRAAEDLVVSIGDVVRPDVYKARVIEALVRAGLPATARDDFAVTLGEGVLRLENLFADVEGEPESALEAHLERVVGVALRFSDKPGGWVEVADRVQLDVTVDAYVDHTLLVNGQDARLLLDPATSWLLVLGAGLYARAALIEDGMTRDLTSFLREWGVDFRVALARALENTLGGIPVGRQGPYFVVGKDGHVDAARALLAPVELFRDLGIARRVVMIVLEKDWIVFADGDDVDALDAMFASVLDHELPPRPVRPWPITRDLWDPLALPEWYYLRPEAVPERLLDPLARLRNLDTHRVYTSVWAAMRERYAPEGVFVSELMTDEVGRTYALWLPRPSLLPAADAIVVCDAAGFLWGATRAAVFALLGSDAPDLCPEHALDWYRVEAFPDEHLDALRELASPWGRLEAGTVQ
ncbi:MAG: hypothetical protein H6736_13795 [Alphaproteobacteria bacterium]|nr:hypothetical protein [Alphaproteobacteria bacterium]